MSGAKILLIEDDDILGATLTENLQTEGYSVLWIRDGAQATSTARQGRFDLIILDRMLPHKEGFQILSEIREQSDLPVMIISAKGSASERILGLQKNADDYLAKPFHLNEFLLRVRNLTKRNFSQRSSLQQSPFRLGKASFDLASLQVDLSDGAKEVLTDKEAKMLHLLWSQANRVVSRQDILNFVWGYQSDPSPRTIDNFIVKLRRWVELDPSDPQIIISHRGLGYSLHTPERNSQS